jgi:hypothetical protein
MLRYLQILGLRRVFHLIGRISRHGIHRFLGVIDCPTVHQAFSQIGFKELFALVLFCDRYSVVGINGDGGIQKIYVLIRLLIEAAVFFKKTGGTSGISPVKIGSCCLTNIPLLKYYVTSYPT